MALTAAEVWRDWNTDGVPASGGHEPNKRDIRDWATLFESLSGGGGPGLGYASKSLLTVDLAHPANTLAIVYNDLNPANNGLYQKSGASGSGSWTRVYDLPNSVIRLTVTGGTGNAIVATAPETPITPASKLYLLTPGAANDSAVTIAVNGASPAPIKNAFGVDLVEGALLEGSQVLMAWSVDHYQLLISANVDADAILAAAQAAAVAAEAAAATMTKATSSDVTAGTDDDKYMTVVKSVQLIIKRNGFIDVEDYGAIGDGLDSSSSVNAQAFADAIAAVGSNGGEIVLRPGRYHTDDAFANLLNKRRIVFRGIGSAEGQSDSVASAEVVLTASSGPLIRLDGTQGILFKDLGLTYNNSGYTTNSVLIDLHSDAGSSITAFTRFENCEIAGWNSSSQNATLINAAKTYALKILGGYWRNAAFGIVGAIQSNRSDYSNAVTVDGIEIDRNITVPIVVGGNNWRFLNMIGEPPSGSTGGSPLSFMMMSPWGAAGLIVQGLSLEDAGDNTGSWLNFYSNSGYGTPGRVEGFTCLGNLFECGSNASGGIAINFGAAGMDSGIISGNTFRKGGGNIGFIGGGENGSDLVVTGNFANSNAGPGVGKIFTGNLPADSLVNNNDGKGLQHTGRLQLSSSTASRAGLSFGSTGVAPTSPNNGEMWFDGTNFKAQIGGVTKTFTLT